MSFLITPILTTPLLKVPILLTNAGSIYFALKPPASAAPRKMQRIATWSAYLTSSAWVQLQYGAIVQHTLTALSLVEAAAIIAAGYTPGSVPRLFDRAASCILSWSGNMRFYATPTFLVGSALTIIGGLLRTSCHRTLGRFYAWQVNTQVEHQLITTGPYGVIRHPGYTALALIALGAPLALLSKGSYSAETGLIESSYGKAAAIGLFGWLAFVAGTLIYRIDEEEELLEETFGEEWRAWARRTRYKLIPLRLLGPDDFRCCSMTKTVRSCRGSW
ncbi:hypothetical protein BV20DRAFT_399692 [Pilatotrama ljubarskyi]|nr:hypothetical protein BV20DRAFT_399692 [Pilatotrama ljubarskyi]